MSVDQTDKIDFLWKDEQSEHVMLTITDHLDWKKRDEGEHLSLLQEKINTYLHFIESGQVWKAKPEYKGLPVIIHVRAKYRPSKEAAKFYKRPEKGVAAVGAHSGVRPRTLMLRWSGARDGGVREDVD